jgi:hypothetical protein
MADGGPYRSSELAIVQTHAEAAACGWCRYSDNVRPLQCSAPGHSPFDGRPFCQQVNPRGHCDYFRPSALTWLLRLLGRRQPMLVSVAERDLKPDNSARTDGLGRDGGGGRGGDVGHLKPRTSLLNDPDASPPAPNGGYGRRC